MHYKYMRLTQFVCGKMAWCESSQIKYTTFRSKGGNGHRFKHHKTEEHRYHTHNCSAQLRFVTFVRHNFHVLYNPIACSTVYNCMSVHSGLLLLVYGVCMCATGSTPYPCYVRTWLHVSLRTHADSTQPVQAEGMRKLCVGGSSKGIASWSCCSTITISNYQQRKARRWCRD